MIKIIEKTPNEVLKEQEQNVEKRVCIKYVQELNQRIDVDTLKEKKVINLIKEDLMDYQAPNGSYKTNPRKLDAIKLSTLVSDNYIPSVAGAFELYRLIPVYGDIIYKLLKEFNYSTIIEKARIIATYFKESLNSFEEVKYEEMMSILSQMVNNEAEKKYVSTKKM